MGKEEVPGTCGQKEDRVGSKQPEEKRFTFSIKNAEFIGHFRQEHVLGFWKWSVGIEKTKSLETVLSGGVLSVVTHRKRGPIMVKKRGYRI